MRERIAGHIEFQGRLHPVTGCGKTRRDCHPEKSVVVPFATLRVCDFFDFPAVLGHLTLLLSVSLRTNFKKVTNSQGRLGVKRKKNLAWS